MVREKSINKKSKGDTDMKKYYHGDFQVNEILTESDKRKITLLNAKNNYGISITALKKLTKQHEKAMNESDIQTAAKIEYRLTDINFHKICNLLHNGKYESARQEINALANE